MKRIFCTAMALCIVLAFASVAGAAPSRARSVPGRSGGPDITIGTSGGKEISLVGHVEPTLITVTMPSYIPFDISKSASTENKVLSPSIDITNNSKVPVSIYVDNTRIDIGQLSGASWGTSANITERQVAIGFTEAASAPSGLGDASWLLNGKQKTDLLRIDSQSSGNLFIVGAIGDLVPENKTFSVTPTLVVKQF